MKGDKTIIEFALDLLDHYYCEAKFCENCPLSVNCNCLLMNISEKIITDINNENWAE